METFVVEGRWAVEALLDSDFDTLEVCFEKGRHRGLVSRLEQAEIPFQVLEAKEIEAVRGYIFHRGVFANVVRPEPKAPGSHFLAQAKKLVIPVNLADPGNLGTVIRSAVAFGADGVVLEKGKGTDVYNAICVRASARALFQVPVFEVKSLENSLQDWKKEGFTIFGMSLSHSSVPISEISPVAASAILLGSEKEGLSSEMETLCNELVTIPMANGMDSLNVAASAAIAFWELWRDEMA